MDSFQENKREVNNTVNETRVRRPFWAFLVFGK